MYPKRTRAFFLVVASSLAFGFCLPAAAASLRCSKDPIVFDFEKNEGLECLCETATAAIHFLRKMGFQTSEPITIKLTDVFPTDSDSLFGSYNPRTQEVMVLEYSKARAASSSKALAPGLDMTQNLWCSFAAHELAHAVIAQKARSNGSSRLSIEYVACVIQLLVMTPATLEALMNVYGDVDGYKSIDEMSETYYLLDPYRFAVKCYLHFISLKDPQQFISELTQANDLHGVR